MRVRDLADGDHAAVLALNNSAVPHVNALTEEQFRWIVEHAGYARVCEDEAGITGFVLAVPQGTEYWSENYRWFRDRFEAFLYLDRVVVHGRARRSGVGRALYTDIAAFAVARWPRIVLEVNLRPPNPVSVVFHERMGFGEVGVREYDEGVHAVVMLELPLAE